jgi:peptide/nickel transport system permease protein
LGITIVFALVFIAIFASFLAPHSPLKIGDVLAEPPSDEHPLGTDMLGRDVMSRVFYGGRASLTVALISTMISLVVGSTLGATSGYFGGKLDRATSLTMDALYAFPSYIMALMIALMLGPTAQNIAVAVGASYSPEYFRVVRSITLSLKEKMFIEAERAVGVSSLGIISRHILPYTLTSLTVLVSMSVADSIVAVAGLGFLGLGIQPPTPEWGTDVRLGRSVFLTGSWWISLFPGMMIFLATVGFNLLGEGINAIIKEKGD